MSTDPGVQYLAELLTGPMWHHLGDAARDEVLTGAREGLAQLDAVRRQAPSTAGEWGSHDGALRWVQRSAWDQPSARERAEEATIPDHHMPAVIQLLERKYRAIAGALRGREAELLRGIVRDVEQRYPDIRDAATTDPLPEGREWASGVKWILDRLDNIARDKDPS